jgi:O-6-methylguanine DNA methyltransferase
MIHYAQIDTPIGPLALARSDRGICRVLFPGEQPFADCLTRLFPETTVIEDSQALAAALRQLSEYFAGKRRQFTLDLDLNLPPFHAQVLQAVSRIPYGTTASYRAIAEQVGRPQAVRAVGNANAANPVPILIPCHRVIAADGSLGGYGGGLPRKHFLLKLEGAWS